MHINDFEIKKKTKNMKKDEKQTYESMYNNQVNAITPCEMRKPLDKHKFFQLIDCHIFKRRRCHISYSNAVYCWLCLEECKQLVGGVHQKRKVEKYKNNSNKKKHCIRVINSVPYEITNAWMITTVLVVVVGVIVTCIMCSGINTIQKRTLLFISTHEYTRRRQLLREAHTPLPFVLVDLLHSFDFMRNLLDSGCARVHTYTQIYICIYIHPPSDSLTLSSILAHHPQLAFIHFRATILHFSPSYEYLLINTFLHTRLQRYNRSICMCLLYSRNMLHMV